MKRGTGEVAARSATVKPRAAGGRVLAGRATAAHARASEDSAALEALEIQLGYRFRNRDLLILALTHSSFIYEERLGRAKTNADEPNRPGTDNEQLEFLGDAVLGLAVTELLVRTFPGEGEGQLTRMRASLVSRKRMAALGEALGLGALLRLGKSAEVGEGRSQPAVLANTAEAVLGAMYLDLDRDPDLDPDRDPERERDKDRDLGQKPGTRARTDEKALRTVREVVERLLVTPDLPAIRTEVAAAGRGALRDAKSRLQERVQAERRGRLAYVDIEETGPAHARRFRVEARLERADGGVQALADAEGGSKKEAQQAAAELALAQWELHAKSHGESQAKDRSLGTRDTDSA